jgi:hypothetical protein
MNLLSDFYWSPLLPIGGDPVSDFAGPSAYACCHSPNCSADRSCCSGPFLFWHPYSHACRVHPHSISRCFREDLHHRMPVEGLRAPCECDACQSGACCEGAPEDAPRGRGRPQARSGRCQAVPLHRMRFEDGHSANACGTHSLCESMQIVRGSLWMLEIDGWPVTDHRENAI